MSLIPHSGCAGERGLGALRSKAQGSSPKPSDVPRGPRPAHSRLRLSLPETSKAQQGLREGQDAAVLTSPGCGSLWAIELSLCRMTWNSMGREGSRPEWWSAGSREPSPPLPSAYILPCSRSENTPEVSIFIPAHLPLDFLSTLCP